MVKYVYDAWGNHAVHDASGNEITSSSHIGIINPFRYRSYFYDVETGLYYLKTRYYDPEICRFISMDSIEYADHETINGLNLYAYCNNNPVNMCDPTGCVAIAITIFASFVAAAIFATYAENTHVVPKKAPKEEKLYTISEAEEKIYQEISKKYTSFERKDISINNESGVLHIENSYLLTDVQTRYNISHIYTKTINDSGKKLRIDLPIIYRRNGLVITFIIILA